MKFLKTLIATVIIFNLASCEKSGNCISGNGEQREELRNPGAFTGVELKIPSSVKIINGKTNSITINAPSNIIGHISTYVIGSTLFIENKDNVCIKNGESQISIEVVTPSLDKALVQGSGTIFSSDSLYAPNLIIGTDGSGNVRMEQVYTENYAARISGSGDIYIAGPLQADNGEIRISGSGEVVSDQLKTNDSYIEISGSGDVWVETVSALDVQISGSGTVYYKGSPNITSEITGSGAIIKQ
jgi:hypothetical protein